MTVTAPTNEHTWHACKTPPPPTSIGDSRYQCDICHQIWLWRRPPRPIAQWIRATPEDN